MFKPKGTCVMVELVEQQDNSGLVIPESAKGNGMIHDLVVRSVGDDVTEFKRGDRVMTPLPKNSQIAKFDDGEGESVFVFWDEADIFGKYVEEDK